MELPPPPDMSELVQAYNQPDGDLDASVAADFGKTLFETLKDNRRASALEMANSLVQNLQDLGGGVANEGKPPPDNAGAGPQQLAGGRFDIAAIARVHRICRGWEDGPADESKNGSIDLTVTLDEGGLIPTVWGTVDRCFFSWDDYFLEMDGEIAMNFGEGQPRVGLGYLGALGYLFTFEGTLAATRDGSRTEVALDAHFKAYLNGKVLMLFELSDGAHVIGMFDPEALSLKNKVPTTTTTLAIQGKTDRWDCSVDNVTGAGSCSSNNDSVITW